MKLKPSLLATSLLSSAAVLGLSSPASAQDAPPPDDTAVEELVVTGSRIRRSEFNSPDPVQVLSSEQSELKGIADTAGLLRSATVISGSPQVAPQVSSSFVLEGGPGAQTVSLRGLGANRTLVLVNGRRTGPAGTRGQVSAVDLNVIPQSIVSSIEILKDGASSIYGSDAIAGVVNILTKRDTEGLEVRAFTQQPEKQGGAEYNISGVWGKTFDRGHLTIAADYYKQNMLRVGNRDYLNCGQQYRTSVAGGGRSDVIDPRTGEFSCQDLLYDQVWIYDFNFRGRLAKFQYDYAGNLGSFARRLPPGAAPGEYPGMPTGFYAVAYDDASEAYADFNSPFNLKSSFLPRIERSTIYAQGDFELTPSVEVYGEVLLNRRATRTDGYRQIWTYLYTGDYDPFNPGWTGDFLLNPVVGIDQNDSSEKVEYQRYLGGLRGSIGGGGFLDGWNWDVWSQYSRSKGLYQQQVQLADSVDAAFARTGSCVGTVTPVGGKNCVDVRWLNPEFLRGNLTPQEIEFLFDEETGRTIYKQFVAEATLSGDVMDLPAGPLSAAVGIQFRRDSINDTPGEWTLLDNVWNTSTAGVTKGKDTTREAFAELSIPLLRDLPMVERLTATVSGRYTKVDSYGEDFTYKAGLNWQVIPSVRVRATHGTSFRAPALYEIYLADQTGFFRQAQVDPCIRSAQNLALGNITQRVFDNCVADGIPTDHSGQGNSATVFQGGGGPGALEAETSKSTTIGFIWTPGFADLSVAVDYFRFQINDEVDQLGNTIPFRCYNSADFPTDQICSLFTRDPDTLIIDAIQDNYINIAKQKNYGIDLTVRYARDLPWDVRMTADLQATWQIKDTKQIFETTTDLNGYVGDPDYTGIFNLAFQKDDWTVFWGVDMIGKASDAEEDSDGQTRSPQTSADGLHRYKIDTEFTAYHSLAVRKQFGDGLEVLMGVANLFDEAPPAVSQDAQPGVYGGGQKGISFLGSQYDFVGRRFHMSVTKKF